MTKPIVILAILAAAIIGIFIFAAGSAGRVEEVSTPILGPGAQASARPAADRTSRGSSVPSPSERLGVPRASSRLAFDFDLGIVVELEMPEEAFQGFGEASDGGSSPTPRERSSSIVRGKLELSRYGKTPEGTLLVGFAIRAIEVESMSGSERATMPASMAAAAIRKEVLVTAGADGNFEAFYLPEEMPIEMRQLVTGVLYPFQVSLPPSDEATWTREEESTLGRMLVRYERSGETEVERRVLAVRELAMAGDLAPDEAPLVETSGSRKIALASTALAPEMHIARIAGLDRTRVESKGLGLVLSVEERTSVVLADAAPGSVSDEERLEALRVLATRRPLRVEPRQIAREAHARAIEAGERAEIEGETVAGILIALGQELRAHPEGSSEAYQARRKLALMIRRDPGVLANVVDLIALDGELVDSILDSSAIAGTPDAQLALVRIARDASLPRSTRESAILAFVHTEQPTREAAMALVQIASEEKDQDLARSAFLLAGGMAGRLPIAADRGTILERIDGIARERESDVEWRLAYLSALGNAALPEVSKRVTPFLSSDDEDVRARAVQALRDLSTPDARARIQTALESDLSEQVRSGALEILRDQGDEAATASIRRALQSDPSERIRLQAIESLAARVEAEPGVREEIQTALQDPSNRVRDRALEILAGATEQGS